MKKYSIIILLAVLALGACKSKKVQAGDTASASTTDAAPPQALNDSIRLTVSFYSPGSGINYLAARKLDSFITNYQSSNNVTVNYEKIPWGREGEVDYCFNLNSLGAKLSADFKAQVKKLLKDEDRINYKENEPCREKRVMPGGN